MQRIENIRPESFANISLLRAIAALMVVYDHLFCIVPLRHFGVAAFPAPSPTAHREAETAKAHRG